MLNGLSRLYSDYFGNSELVNEIDSDGNSNFFISNLVGVNCNNLVDTAKKHVILTPALLFVSRMFSQAEFKLYDESGLKEIKNHYVLDILNNPNSLQTRSDFLEAQMFMKISSGVSCIQKLKISTGHIVGLRVLDTSLIRFPDSFNSKIWVNKNSNAVIKYGVGDDDNVEKIKIKDLLFSYDLPVGFNGKNSLKPISRLEGQKQTLINSTDIGLAKNIIVKSNGKELISAKSGSLFPFAGGEETEVKENFNKKYGLGLGRSRAIITKAAIEHKSLHIPLRDLGLDESLKSDCDLIMLCLNIPRDILGLTNKKSTYNNVGESYIGYIESEMQSSADDFADTIRRGFIDEFPELVNYKLKSSYQHLSFMASSNKKKYDTLVSQAEALQGFLDAGLSWEDALDKVGMDKKLTQNLKKINNTNTD